MLRQGLFAILLVSTPAAAQTSLTAGQIARIDSIFVQYSTNDGPGCSLGISRHDSVVLERAWGSADLEHSVPITPATIFEGGSVSKQFTAAAVFRLAQQGKLSLDDDIRKYLSQLPAYDAPITINNLIHHTSGLRDWGTIMSMAGWPRGTRTYTHAHVLDIVARQRALNYPVGTEYLYSNSNYNLLAIIAERVSGKTLAEFTKTELFAPLGMTSTGWRDDFTRIVRGRAQAYRLSGKEWHLEMPFENVYGNSSLLTTVGDLLKWDANLASKRVGGEQFVSMQQTKGRLKNGRVITYAGGMFVDSYQGTPEIAHTGSTAGYRAFLARYPEAGFAVALLCNAATANPGTLGRRVSTVVLPPYKSSVIARDTVGVSVPVARLSSMVGYYRHAMSDEPLHLEIVGGRIINVNGPKLIPVSFDHYTSMSGQTHFAYVAGASGARGRVRTWGSDVDTTQYLPVGAPLPTDSYNDYLGVFTSTEAEAILSVLLEDGKLELFQGPSTRISMKPIYSDGFDAEGSYVKFVRGSDGKVNALLVTSERARNVRFDRMVLPVGSR